MIKNSGRRVRKPRGFSLLEIIIVLSVAIVIAGSAAFLMGAPEEEERLRDEHAKIGDLARQARSMSVAYQVPFVIVLKEGEVSLSPLNRPTQEVVDEKGFSLNSMEWPRVKPLLPDYDLEVKRWGELDGKVVTGNMEERWIFEPNGLCEPVQIRFFKDDGANSLTRVFHPLTAMAEDVEKTITVQK